ncbi:hypothetical protein CRENBAI_000367 [Crenichthys baileyi]|uniref:Uncharacterized protein n=1 Tax=Crenichthys baileyi TaxID=28760 RepID=A0AAV9SHB3_9TELE
MFKGPAITEDLSEGDDEAGRASRWKSLTDSLAADSDLHTCIACVRSWVNGINVHGGRLPPGLCITDNLYKEVRSPPPQPPHLPAITSKDLDLVKFTHRRDIRGLGIHD